MILPDGRTIAGWKLGRISSEAEGRMPPSLAFCTDSRRDILADALVELEDVWPEI